MIHEPEEKLLVQDTDPDRAAVFFLLFNGLLVLKPISANF